MRTNKQGAFTLIETIVTLSILSLLLVLIFGTFGMATSIFQDTDVRQSAELQLRGIKLLMERDLELSDYWHQNSLHRDFGTDPDTAQTVWRDAVSVCNLSDWKAVGNFDPVTGRPIWNRHVVWYATQENEAKLIRQVVEPGGPVTEPYSVLSSNVSDSNPNANADLLHSRVLSESIKNFQVIPRPQNGTVGIILRLRKSGAHRPNSMEKTEENLELAITFLPRNTWPKI